MNATRELLRELAAHDERSLRAALRPSPHTGGDNTRWPSRLDRRTRALVELAALIAADASTSSLRWAVERAAAAGADDPTLVRVLETAASAAGAAQTVQSAPRLALALDLDTGVPEQA